MRSALHGLISLIWGLWFGGVVTLFVAVTAIFKAFPDEHEVAGEAARYVFHAFNIYQLSLAVVALLGTFAWSFLKSGPMKLGLFLLFSLVTSDACIIATYVAPKIELLQRSGLGQSHEFSTLHGISLALYLAEAVLLLIAGLFLLELREPNT